MSIYDELMSIMLIMLISMLISSSGNQLICSSAFSSDSRQLATSSREKTSFYLSNTAPVFFIKVFCDLVAILFFGSHFVCQNLFRLSIRTSMQNLDSVAQEMSELCSILRFGGHFVFQKNFGLSILTSMQNLDSVALEMSELCTILQFGGHFVFTSNISKKFKICNFHIFKNFLT